MDLLQAIILGLIQGLTEFLPISSSGHLLLVPALFGWSDPGAGFTAVIQLGTLGAVFVYFWRDLVEMMRAWGRSLSSAEARKEPNARLAWAVLIGTIPVIIAGLLLEKSIDSTLRSPYIVAATLIVFGLVLFVAEKIGTQTRNLEKVNRRDGLWIGLWQCLALIPGSSRSGSTITGALFLGFDRASAARFSFLLSVPAILGSGLYKLFKERHALFDAGAMPTVVATVVAFASGYAAIAFLMKYLQTRTTTVFVVYRVVLGIVVAVLAWQGVLKVRPVEVKPEVVSSVF
jgi:undecaprenyl-diphosphatase